MATTPTQDAVPSESPRDLKFNAGKIDEFVTSESLVYTDRKGCQHYTISGINYNAQQAINSFGYVTLVGVSFTTGATINQQNEVLLSTSNGEYYKWTGSLASGPKVVPANSTPESAGGIGVGKWIGVGDASLRGELEKNNSEIVISGQAAKDIAANKIKTKYTERDADVYDLIVTYGQSNSAGEAALSGDTSGFPDPLERSLMYDFTDNTIKPIIQAIVSSSGVTSSGHAWGEFANEWYRQSGHGSVVVHCGRGATSLQQLSKGQSGGYYEKLVSAVAATKSKMIDTGMPIGKIFVIFHQGETDQLNGTTFDVYRALMVALLDDLVADIGMDLFANCTVGCPSNRTEQSWATIQNAQRYVCNGRDFAVTAFDGCPSFLNRDGNVGTEGVHYTQKGYNTMGFGAARGLWSVFKGGKKTKTEVDLLQYTANNVSPSLRAKHCAASARVSSVTNSWAILNRMNDTGTMRPANINTVTNAPDGNSLYFTIADNASAWFDFNCGMSRDAVTMGLYNIVERFNTGTDYNLRMIFYADITIIVNVNTGELRYGRVPSALPAWMAANITATGSSGKAVINHGATDSISTATHYGSATSTADPNVTVSIYTPSTTQTQVYLSNIGSSPWVAVSLKRVLITPTQVGILNPTIYVSGTYAPEF